MQQFHASPGERCRSFLDRRREGTLAGCEAVSLAGDASNRVYFRLVRPGRQPLVLALLPAPFEPGGFPFLEARSLLLALGIRVPDIHEISGPEGALLLEDLGDRLLQNVVAEVSEEEKAFLYRDATDIIVTMQRGSRTLDPGRFLPLRTAFDEKKFYDELEFFRLHCLVGLRAGTPSAAEQETLAEAFRRIAAKLASQPFALCHRDYHARNLLCLPSRSGLAVIDFQDARMGPRTYDLASLLNDSYVAHRPSLVEEMKERFASAVGKDVSAEYDLAALQRNLKALGTFGYQIHERSNEVYRQYVEPTLALVRVNLERHRRWDSLRRALAGSFPELA